MLFEGVAHVPEDTNGRRERLFRGVLERIRWDPEPGHPEARPVEPGPLGGSVECLLASPGGDGDVICGRADEGTAAVAPFEDGTLADAGKLYVGMRGDLERLTDQRARTTPQAGTGGDGRRRRMWWVRGPARVERYSNGSAGATPSPDSGALPRRPRPAARHAPPSAPRSARRRTRRSDPGRATAQVRDSYQPGCPARSTSLAVRRVHPHRGCPLRRRRSSRC
ncbi:hypothetical protein SGRIM128S_05070 [Streptomyces griseomycini]